MSENQPTGGTSNHEQAANNTMPAMLPRMLIV
jgi:hypothetical protein